MKMEISIKIVDDDGSETITPIAIDTEIPNFDEFIDSNNFREVFDKYEKAVLRARNSAAELASEQFLSELSKKKLLPKNIEQKNLQ